MAWEEDKEHKNRWRNGIVVVCVSNTFVGDRKPEANIWKQKEGEYAEYIVSGKKFNTFPKALNFAKKWMKKYDKAGFKELWNKAVLEVTQKESPLICNIRDYRLNQNLRLYKGSYYSDYDTWNNKKYSSKDVDGKNQSEFIKVGKKLFRYWCKKSELCVTQTGNMTFSSWWTVDIEPHHVNKSNVRFSKKNFERVFNGAKAHYEKYRNRKSDHDHFSYPKIKWFKVM